MRYVTLIAFLVSASVSTSTPLGAQQIGAMEEGVNLPGMDYRNFELPSADPDLCRRACVSEDRCRSYTYVKPGEQGPKARCWLKYGIPQPERNACCISGTRQRAAAALATAQPVPGPATTLSIASSGPEPMNFIWPSDPDMNSGLRADLPSEFGEIVHFEQDIAGSRVFFWFHVEDALVLMQGTYGQQMLSILNQAWVFPRRPADPAATSYSLDALPPAELVNVLTGGDPQGGR